MIDTQIGLTRTERTKANILEVASQLFEKEGISNVTFDDIAKATGHSRTTVYSHFANKDVLLDSISLAGMQYVEKALQKVRAQPLAADKQLRYMSYELIAFYDEKPFFYKCMMDYIDASPEGRKTKPILEEIYQTGERLNENFASILKAGLEEGVFRDDILVFPTGLIFLSWAMSLVSIFRNKGDYISSKEMSRNEFYEYGFKLLMRTIIKGA